MTERKKEMRRRRRRHSESLRLRMKPGGSGPGPSGYHESVVVTIPKPRVVYEETRRPWW